MKNEEGRAYHLLFDVTPTAAGDCFLYFKNTSDDEIVVEGLYLRTASAEQINIKLGVTGTPSGGSTVTPANCNAGSSNTAEGTFQTGNDITGLSAGTTVEKFWLTTTESKYFNFEQDIIIPKNGVMSICAVTGGINISGTVIFNYYRETY